MDKKRQVCLHEIMQELITVNNAAEIIAANLYQSDRETLPLSASHGRILQQTIHSDRDLPPFDRVMMDGIAIAHQSWAELNRHFPIQSTQAAGATALSLADPDHCIEVMTGAPLPAGCDTVVPVEQLTIEDGIAQIQACASLAQGQHIHRQGSDTTEGSSLLSPSTLLTAPELSIAASCGAHQLTVSAIPSLLIISTGDELVAPDQSPQPHQIRRSHFTALHSSITRAHLATCEEIHIADDPDLLRETIKQALASHDILVLTGGVSRGKFDYVAPILAELLGQPHFHGVAQRPGKPLAYWKNKDTPPVFALPGNPVSVMACAARYLLPALRQIATGATYTPEQLPASGSFNCPKHFTGLIPSVLKNGKLTLQPPSNSGNFLALAGTHGIAEITGQLSGQPLLNETANFYPW